MELGEFKIRDLLMFMSDHEFPKRQFVQDKEKLLEQIHMEIKNITSDLKKVRLAEIEKKNLNSLLIIPSWSKILEKQTMGFYLNRPVIDISRDTIVMLNNDIEIVSDKLGKEFALISGPGVLFTEFSLDPGKYITNQRSINLILLPLDHLERLLNAPPITRGELHGSTINELITIIPFSLIEEAYTIQALIRGIISRNVFHPNKAAIDAFTKLIKAPESFNVREGFQILSAHDENYNRLMIVNPLKSFDTKDLYNLSSAGVASIVDGTKLLNELLTPEQQNLILIKIRDVIKEYKSTGEKLIYDWLP